MNPNLSFSASLPLRIFILLALLAACAQAQVPSLIGYQGRVTVGTANFNGTGQFKFALVNAAGSTTYWSNDGTSTAGSQPANAVSLTVTNGLYSVLLGDATLPNMTTVPGTVFNNADVRLRVWFNDGVNGSQQLAPDQRIAAVGYAMIASGVTAGAITSSMIANGAVGSSQLGNGAVQSSHITAGAVGSTQLAAGAAASNLDASAGMISSPSENPALVAAGWLKTGSVTIRPEAWAQSATKPALSPRQDAAAVWTGSEFIVWGGFHGQARNDGARYNPTTGVWTRMNHVNAPAPRYGHRAIWTGTEMVVVGGLSGENAPPSPVNSQVFIPGAVGGGRYNPATDTWTALAGLPRLYEHIAVWNGTDILILGGYDRWVANFGIWNAQPLQTPVRYNLASGTSTPVYPVAPVATQDLQRVRHSGIWTGTEFIVWGGTRFVGSVRGFRYDPVANTWTNITSGGGAPGIDAPGHTGVWTGTQLYLWGGGIGARYNPATSTWSTISTTGFANNTTNHSAVWDGSGMIVTGSNGTKRYDPATATWASTAMPVSSSRHVAAWTGSQVLTFGDVINGSGRTFNLLHHYTPTGDVYSSDKLAPIGRYAHTAIWTGTAMLIFGGADAAGVINELVSYNPTTDEWSWLPIGGPSAPAGRRDHTAVWNGTEMIIWGGTDGTNRLGTGALYNTTFHYWQSMTAPGAPAARSLHTAVWTGSRMLVWGGGNGTTKFGDGAAFNPAGAGSWTPMNAAGAPSAREGHTMTWTGTEAVVWGGEDSTPSGTNTGARYQAAGDSWTAMTTTGAPAARTAHTAVFGNSEIIISGGVPDSASTAPFVDGGRYSLAGNTWIPVTASGFGRVEHATIWTGVEMIAWGGRDSSGYFGSVYQLGSRYSPVLGTSSLLSEPPDTSPRGRLTAIWNGNQMILYGGSDGTTYPSSTLMYTPKLELFFYTQP